MSPQEISDWASAYIDAEKLPSNEKHGSEHWWAIERFMNLHDLAQAEDAWCAILEIVSRSPAQEIIGMLAAGPVEDLIEDWGVEFIDRIEFEARRNPEFRHVLGGVWRSSTPDVWQRVERARVSSW